MNKSIVIHDQKRFEELVKTSGTFNLETAEPINYLI
jgi:hypothetical protein